jgi:hypothetical protein
MVESHRDNEYNPQNIPLFKSPHNNTIPKNSTRFPNAYKKVAEVFSKVGDKNAPVHTIAHTPTIPMCSDGEEKGNL